jgi:hypothetical protein
MSRRARLLVVALMSLAFLPLRLVSAQPGTPAASPAAVSPTTAVMLTEGEVPEGLVMTDDRERTLTEVASGFAQPEAAERQFKTWGWRANSVRAFHTPASVKADPQQIDGIYISVHQFGTPEDAAAAMAYSVQIHTGGTKLEEQDHEPLGDSSVVLYGPMPYGNEVTYYVQQGDLLIRLSASSPKGDPSPVAEGLIATMLAR